MHRQLTLWLSVAIFLVGLPGFTYAQTRKELLDKADSLSKAQNQDSAIVLTEASSEKRVEELETENTNEAARNRIKELLDREYSLFRAGRFDSAIVVAKLALEAAEAQLDMEDAVVALILHRMGLDYYYQGNLAEAESLTKRALAIRKKVLSTAHPDIAKTLNNLGIIYMDGSRYPEAETVYRQALTIQEQTLGPNHPDLASVLTNLAIVYMRQEKYLEAEPLYKRALSLKEDSFGHDAPGLSSTLISLAALYKAQRRYDEAESLYKRQIAIKEKAHGQSHPAVAYGLRGLAKIYQKQGRFFAAEPLFMRALSIDEGAFGPDHPMVARDLEMFSDYYRIVGNDKKSLTMAHRAHEIRYNNFLSNAWAFSEEDALKYSRSVRYSAHNYLSCYSDLASPSQRIDSAVANIILFTKGQVSDGIFERCKALVAETDSTTLALAESFRFTKSQLSKLFVEGPGKDLDSYRAKVDSLARLANELEADLSRHSASFRKQQDYKNISVDRITSLLPDRSILVEYLKYDYLQLQPDSVIPHYLVVVMESDKQPVITELGKATDIDTLISEYREHLLRLSSQRHMPLEKDKEAYEIIARKLYDAAVRPIEDHLSGKELVLIAPDGGLNLVSFAGLVDEEGKYLIEKFPIHHLSSGRELIRLKDPVAGGQGLLAIGDPDYNATAITRKEQPEVVPYASTDGDYYATRSLRSGCEFFSGLSMAMLPGTRREIDLVADSWRTNSDEPAAIYFGPQASEDVFKAEAPGKRVIHLATHGYFISGQCEALSRTGRSNFQGSYAGENPLLQSGLFFAGANLHGEGADSAGVEDGILTAYEVSAMDLQGTELVVLSACETGLGEVRQSEGVYGLRRAFQMAGVRTVVSALWPVPDKQTATIMGELYSATGESLPTKLRRIQLDRIASLRSQQLADHPYSWAAFIALGDWR